jgi:hypothetical protein
MDATHKQYAPLFLLRRWLLDVTAQTNQEGEHRVSLQAHLAGGMYK